MIEALLSSSRHERRRAFDAMVPDAESAYAARDVLAFDDDANVRARAAWFLGRAPHTIAAPALRDALHDEMPLVRHAAVRALTMQADRASIARLERIVVEEPVWWVRRAAIVAVTSVAKEASISTLRAALDDPFWRVRHAAVRALLALGQPDAERLMSQVGRPTSERSAGAIAYLNKRFGLAKQSLEGPTEVPNAIVALLDPDPAVVTARVERGDVVSPAFLVECLGDPHEALRATAKKRLAAAPDARTLELALLWLEEPRIPHAAETVISLLDDLDAEHVGPLLDHALEGEAQGATCWAASYVGLAGDESRLPRLLVLARAARAQVRRVALAALGAFSDARVTPALRHALADADPDVVRIAAHALLDRRDPAAADALASTSTDTPDVLLRRLLVMAADARADVTALERALDDHDALVRSTALGALVAHDALDAAQQERFASDPDPWVRAAVLDAGRAERVLAADPQPALRRSAFSLVRDRRKAGALAATSRDPWLRARAAALLDPRVEAELRTLLVLARDPVRAVRAAAADRLDRAGDLDALLDRALATETRDELRIAALAHRARAFDDATLARLRSAREGESPAVRAWIDDVLSGFAPSRPVVESSRAERRPVAVAREQRALGGTGMHVSPLAISGAGNLAPRAYLDAMHAGCNIFFWEPRYQALGSMLRRSRDARVIAGTYHASAHAIVADVERSLRRLRRDVLDVFLLFWVRSPARVSEESFAVLSRLKEQGKIRAAGFSTHDRAIACSAIQAHPWDVIMTRHSAAHPGAEDAVLPLARAKNVGVLGFSAVSYGRLLTDTISATDAYRYSLSQPAISACVSAPRSAGELTQNLAVLEDASLSLDRQAELRAHGRTVREESRDFGHTIRRHPLTLADATPNLERWLDHEDVSDHHFE